MHTEPVGFSEFADANFVDAPGTRWIAWRCGLSTDYSPGPVGLAPGRGFRQSKYCSRQGLHLLTGAPASNWAQANGLFEKPSTLSRFARRCTASDPHLTHRE